MAPKNSLMSASAQVIVASFEKKKIDRTESIPAMVEDVVC
jgi:hypothetical protein